MSLQLSAIASSISPSATLGLNATVTQLRSQGVDVISLGAGEPDFDTPYHIRQAAKEAIDAGKTRYTDVSGIPELRKAIVDHIFEHKKLRYEPDEIIVSSGAKQAIVLALQAILDPQDEVILPSPYWISYTEMIKIAGGKPVFISTTPDTDFLPTPEQLAAAVTEHTKAIIINSPNNPSGAVYSEETLKRLAKILKDKESEYGHDIFLISDEPYREIVFDGKKAPYPAAYYDNTLTCYSFSKSLSLPGERIGYIAVSPTATDADILAVICGQISRGIGHNCPASTPQLGVAKVIDETSDLSVYEINRNIIYDTLVDLGYTVTKPGGTFYIMPKCMEEDSVAFCNKAKEYDLILVPTDGFGAPGFFRMAYCIDTEKVKRAMDVMRKFTEECYK